MTEQTDPKNQIPIESRLLEEEEEQQQHWRECSGDVDQHTHLSPEHCT